MHRRPAIGQKRTSLAETESQSVVDDSKQKSRKSFVSLNSIIGIFVVLGMLFVAHEVHGLQSTMENQKQDLARPSYKESDKRSTIGEVDGGAILNNVKVNEASLAMLAQKSEFVDGEKKLKAEGKKVMERQKNNIDLGVWVASRWVEGEPAVRTDKKFSS